MENLTISPSAGAKTNFVLIILDTHRADRMGLNGYARSTTPNLDAFARSATVFENAVAPAQWTIPSHASMFTGLPPTSHLVTQANSVLDDHFTTFAEFLSAAGYETVGFCNNPLLGLIHNNLRRGFETFYNYSGTTPDIPQDFPQNSVYPFVRTWDKLASVVRRTLDPIQNKFATSNKLLVAATNPLFVPLWTRFVHFKGNTRISIRHSARFLAQNTGRRNATPYLFFLNLMETHLPFFPPREYIQRFAPYVKDEPAAEKFMRSFNKQAMQWLIPLKTPFTELEASTLSDMYDAEVAYQDHLLGELLETLERPAIRDNTMVIIAADHGEMLGEHNFMGHGFGAYKELVQVPLMIRLPGQTSGRRIARPVSTTRLFHTILDTAGMPEVKNQTGETTNNHINSLLYDLDLPAAPFTPQGYEVVTEAYAPQDAIQMMEKFEPELIPQYQTRKTHRAVYSQEYKLYAIEDVRQQLLTLLDQELNPESEDFSAEASEQARERLAHQLERFVSVSREGHPIGWAPATADLSDPLIEQQLRDLGYMA